MKTKSVKVLIFLPAGVGGAERVGVTIGKILHERGHHIGYVIMGNEQSNINKIMPCDEDGYVRHYIANDYNRWYRMYKLIKSETPDVVFASCRAVSRDLVMVTKPFGLKCKVIVRSDNPLKTLPAKRRKWIRWAFRFADMVIAQQEEMRQEMINEYPIPENKVVALQNPIDYEGIRQQSSVPSPYLDENVVRYVWVARIAEYATKGQDVLLHAFKIVHDNNPHARLYLVGIYNEEGQYYQSLRNFINENNLNDVVYFVGFDPNPYRWVKYANCFVLPSRGEGLPNSMIEAMYLEKPVVATRCLPIIDRMVEDGVNGYRVEVEDYEAMADAMLKAVKLTDCKMSYNPASNEEFVKLFES